VFCVLLQVPAENCDAEGTLANDAQTTSIQRLNRSLWSDTSATNIGTSKPVVILKSIPKAHVSWFW